MQIKLVLGATDGKSYQKELTEEESATLHGKTMRQKISGESLGLAGYELLITGGSDMAGFPMRADVPGAARKKILAVEGIGLKKSGKGVRIRRSVIGTVVGERTSQVNCKVLKEGTTPLAQLFPAKEKKEEKK